MKALKVFYIPIIFLLSFTLSCDLINAPDDGGNDDKKPEPLEIVLINPEEGATNVSIDTEILIQFDKSIDEDSVRFSLSEDNDISLSGSFEIRDKEFIFFPEILDNGVSYTASIKATDLDGNEVEYSWTFTTESLPEPPKWQSSCNINSIDIDSEGNTYFSGTYRSESSVCVGKFSSEGNLVWENKIDKDNNNLSEVGSAIELSSDKNFIYVTRISRSSDKESQPQPFLFVDKFNTEGEHVWTTKVFEGASFALEVEDPYIYVGEISGNGGLAKLDDQGNILETRSEIPAVESIVYKDNNLYLGGSTRGNKEFYLKNLDPNTLETNWEKTYTPGGEGVDQRWRGLIEIAPDQERIYLVGSNIHDNNKKTAVILGLNMSGDIQWTTTTEENSHILPKETALDYDGNLYFISARTNKNPMKVSVNGDLINSGNFEIQAWGDIEIYDNKLYICYEDLTLEILSLL